MELKFRATVESTVTTCNGEVTLKQIIEHENPETLLNALSYVAGSLKDMPTVEKLLTHLFVKRAQYTTRNYFINVFYE